MGTSGNPANRAKELKVSDPKEFKSRKYRILELPSGLTVKVKGTATLATFMRAGMIPNALMGVVDGSLRGAEAKPEDIMPDGKVDMETVTEMMEFLDKVVVRVFLEPRVLPVPENEDDRDEDELYADEIDDDDKMFVFQWLSGGTADLTEFRERQAANVAALGGSN